MPSIYNVDQFLKEEGSYMIFWYANWRKWPLKYKVWENVANLTMVQFACKECPTSIAKKETWLAKTSTGLVRPNCPKNFVQIFFSRPNV